MKIHRMILQFHNIIIRIYFIDLHLLSLNSQQFQIILHLHNFTSRVLHAICALMINLKWHLIDSEFLIEGKNKIVCVDGF